MARSPIEGVQPGPLPVFRFTGRSDPVFALDAAFSRACSPLRDEPPPVKPKGSRAVRINNVSDLKEGDPLLQSLSRTHSVTNLVICDNSGGSRAASPVGGSPPSSARGALLRTGSSTPQSAADDRVSAGIGLVLASAPRLGAFERLELNMGGHGQAAQYHPQQQQHAQDAPLPSLGDTASPHASASSLLAGPEDAVRRPLALSAPPSASAPISAGAAAGRWMDRLPCLLEPVDDRLHELTVSVPCLDPEAANAFAELLATNRPPLQRLELCATVVPLRAGAVLSVAEGLRFNTDLRELSLSGVAAQDVALAVQHVCDGLAARRSPASAGHPFVLRVNGVTYGSGGEAGVAVGGSGGAAAGIDGYVDADGPRGGLR